MKKVVYSMLIMLCMLPITVGCNSKPNSDVIKKVENEVIRVISNSTFDSSWKIVDSEYEPETEIFTLYLKSEYATDVEEMYKEVKVGLEDADIDKGIFKTFQIFKWNGEK